MSLTRKQKEEHALRLIRNEIRDFEFSYVYEDEELEAASEQDQSDIHDLIVDARVSAVFPE